MFHFYLLKFFFGFFTFFGFCKDFKNRKRRSTTPACFCDSIIKRASNRILLLFKYTNKQTNRQTYIHTTYIHTSVHTYKCMYKRKVLKYFICFVFDLVFSFRRRNIDRFGLSGSDTIKWIHFEKIIHSLRSIYLINKQSPSPSLFTFSGLISLLRFWHPTPNLPLSKYFR